MAKDDEVELALRLREARDLYVAQKTASLRARIDDPDLSGEDEEQQKVRDKLKQDLTEAEQKANEEFLAEFEQIIRKVKL